MAYSSYAITNKFIELGLACGADITPKKLQRMLFCAQVLSTRKNSSPLIDDFFVKWPTGPVVPGLYHKLKAYEGNSVDQRIWIASANPDVKVYPAVPAEDLKTLSLIYAVAAKLLPLPLDLLSMAVNEISAFSALPECAEVSTEILHAAQEQVSTLLATLP